MTGAVGVMLVSGLGASILAATTIAKNPLTRFASVKSVGKTATERRGFMPRSELRVEG
jgi:hypothetical protein